MAQGSNRQFYMITLITLMILIILMISHKGLHRNLPLDGPWIISRVHPVWRRWRKPSRFPNPIMLVTFFHFPKIPFQQLTPTPHSPLFPLQAAPREVQADQGRTVATPMAVALPTDPTQKILSSMTSLLLNGPLGAPRWLVGGRFVPHCLHWIYSMSPLILEVF